MSFIQEPTGYEKTILSDLQGAWSLLRESVVDSAGFEGWVRIPSHSVHPFRSIPSTDSDPNCPRIPKDFVHAEILSRRIAALDN